MIIVYKTDEMDYTSNGLIVLDRYATSATVTDELNGEQMLEVRCVLDSRLLKVTNGMVIKAPVPIRETPLVQLYDQTGYDVYVVKTPTGEDETTQTVYARQWETEEEAIELARLEPRTRVITSDAVDGWHEVVIPSGARGYMKSGTLEYLKTEYKPPINGDVITPTKTREQLYRIHSVEKTLDEIVFLARHVSYDAIGNYITGAPTGPAGASTHVQRMMDHLAFATRIKVYSGATGTANLDLNRTNPIEALLGSEGIVASCGGEVLRDNWDIYHADRIGQDRGVSIAYRKNMTGMTVKISTENVVTYILPIGYDADDNPIYLNDTTERYVVSSHVSDYQAVYVYELDCHDVKMGDIYTTTEEVREEIRRRAEAMFTDGADLPEVEAQVDFVDLRNADTSLAASLQAVYVGDTVHLRHENYGIDMELEVVAGTWDCIAGEWISIELGTKKTNLANCMIDPSMIPEMTVKSYQMEPGSVGLRHLSSETNDTINEIADATSRVSTEMRQNLTRITTIEQNIGDIREDMISNFVTALRFDEATKEITQTQSEFRQTVNGFAGIVSQLSEDNEEIKSYIVWSPQTGLILGDSESVYKSRISNDGYDILQGDEPVVHIADHQAYIPELEVTSNLAVGDRDNGQIIWTWCYNGYGLRWVSS